MASTIYAALYNPSGALQYKSVEYGPNMHGQMQALASALQMVALFVKREISSQVFWDEFSGQDAYALREEADGVSIYTYDSSGQGTARVQPFKNDGTTQAIRQFATSLSDVMMGGGAAWDVLGGGSGSLYAEKLAAARSYMASNYGAPY